jgi:hypothetical protein
MLAHWQNYFRDGKMADSTIAVVILINRLQDGVRERMVRHRNAVQRADNILRRRPVMVVEGMVVVLSLFIINLLSRRNVLILNIW